jgi:class 3 adenylate cyclase/predicted ATPase
MVAIAKWLDGIGLGQYAAVFEENDVDLEVLPHLSEAELAELGLSLGHRKKLLAAIAELTDQEKSYPDAERPVQRAAESEGERRQLTVMFCDLVGSTSLSERLDPEDMRSVLRAYQDTCAKAVNHFDGHVAKYIGDGLLIYFGYPQAHEDDPQRAVRAGLDLIEGVAALSEHLSNEHDIEIEVRVAAHTGLVVVGEMGGGATREQHAIVGETPNVAARLENLAKPGSMVISESTHRLVDGLFECEDLGLKPLKGVSEPVRIFQVISENLASSRFEVAAERGLTELVGRGEEIALLMKRWEQAKDGEGQLVSLSGEAGVGKSRIVRGFRERLEGEAHSRILYYASAFHQNTAFHPVIDQIERAMRFDRGDTPQEKYEKLQTTLTVLGVAGEETAPALAALLNLDIKERQSTLGLSPQQLKPIMLEALVSVVEAMARQQPVLIVLEDLHWADPSTRELFDLYAERIRNSRVLALATFRPEFEAPWSGYAHGMALALNRLSRREAIELVGKVTNGKTLPSEVLDQIIDRTDGIPLFVEELTKTILESGLVSEEDDRFVLAGSLSDLAIPASLQDSLMARLDRLAPVKEVAQLAAVIGRVFDHELLAAVSELKEADLIDALSLLIDAELVFRRGIPPQASYEFKHALVQDVAYQSLLKSSRHEHHRRIAETIDEHFPEICGAQPELVARHYTEAGLLEKAVPLWIDAAQQAAMRFASQEVIAQCERALQLLQELPKTDFRDRQELDLLLLLGPAQMVAIGFGSSASTLTYQRAHDLAAKIDDDSALFTVTWGLWLNHQQRAKIDQARGLVKDVEKIASRQGNPEMDLQANHASWTTHLVIADLDTVRKNVERGLAIYDRDQHGSHVFRYGGHDPGVCALIHGALALWAQGYPDQSILYAQQAIELAEEISHPLSLAIALAMASFTRQHRGEISEVLSLAQRTIDLCSERGIPHYLAVGHIVHGWAVVSSGQPELGLAEMLNGLEIYGKTGAALRQSYYLTLLADAYSRSGQVSQALTSIENANQAVELVGERWWHADVQRVRGELVLAQSPEKPSEAENSFKSAVEIARSQGAKSLELRAATSLARLLRHQNRSEEAQQLLAPVYDWFNEGHETADLQKAKTLIEELV